MGTASSRGGPTDKAKLLPSWALPGGSGAPDEPGQTPGDSDGSPLGTTDGEENHQSGDAGYGTDSERTPIGEGDEAAADSDAGNPPSTTSPPPVTSGVWRDARSALTRAATSGGGSRGARIRSAAGSYVRARGGAGRAAAQSRSARTTVSRLSGFLSTLGRGGVTAALRSLNLANYIGRNAEEVFAAIADALSPSGALVEDAAVRAAINDVLGELYDRVAEADGDLAVLDTMPSAEVTAAIESCVAACIYERWVSELGLSIERGATSASAAVDLERGMRAYIDESVKLEIGDRDPLSIDWAASEGTDLIDRVFRDAYSFLESKA